MAIDLDGTLLRRDGSLSERTIDTLERVRSRGVTIVIATARPPRGVIEIARAAGLDGIAICQNGAVSVDLTTGAIVDRFPLPPHVAGPLIDRLKARLPTSALAAEAGAVFRHEVHYESRYPFPVDAEIVTAEALADDRLTKLLVRDPGRGFEELVAIVIAEVGDHATVTTSDTTFVDITAVGVTKLAALQRLANSATQRGIEEVMAFGDMPIDLPMLLWAGRGVAVANAHPEVLAAARHRTLSNDEDARRGGARGGFPWSLSRLHDEPMLRTWSLATISPIALGWYLPWSAPVKALPRAIRRRRTDRRAAGGLGDRRRGRGLLASRGRQLSLGRAQFSRAAAFRHGR